MERQHVPYLVILLRALEDWKQKVRPHRCGSTLATRILTFPPSALEQHEGRLPDPSTADRKAFIDSVNAFRDPSDADAENIEEAAAAINNHVFRPIRSAKEAGGSSTEGNEAGVPAEIKVLFRNPKCDKVDANVRAELALSILERLLTHRDFRLQSTNFWLLVRALRSFVHASSTDAIPGGDGSLPQPGALPDMKALSATYISLQKLYHAKAEADLAAFQQHLDVVLKEAGVPSAIPEAEVRSFVKHAAFLKVVRGKQLGEQNSKPDPVDGESRARSKRCRNVSSSASYSLANHIVSLPASSTYQRWHSLR